VASLRFGIAREAGMGFVPNPIRAPPLFTTRFQGKLTTIALTSIPSQALCSALDQHAVCVFVFESSVCESLPVNSTIGCPSLEETASGWSDTKEMVISGVVVCIKSSMDPTGDNGFTVPARGGAIQITRHQECITLLQSQTLELSHHVSSIKYLLVLLYSVDCAVLLCCSAALISFSVPAAALRYAYCCLLYRHELIYNNPRATMSLWHEPMEYGHSACVTLTADG
jgi:hypothetical protein